MNSKHKLEDFLNKDADKSYDFLVEVKEYTQMIYKVSPIELKEKSRQYLERIENKYDVSSDIITEASKFIMDNNDILPHAFRYR
ncbi:MAG: hypothetical protein R3321_15595 [Nitrososphaeraceae archaeon]|nr:hypothetical protein [Nitrososphaeraceae archaeon]